MGKYIDMIEPNTFAEACYNGNTIDELEAADCPDEFDMDEWDIDEDEWRESIELALCR